MVKLEIKGKVYWFPESIEELKPEDFKRVCGFLLQPWTPGLQYTLIRLLLPIDPKVFTELDDDELLALLPLVDFLNKPFIPKPIRVFRLGLRGFWLPEKMKIRAVDYVQSEPLLKNFVKTQNPELLDLLVATLCRPRKWWLVLFPFARLFNLQWDGDPREKFHSEIVALRAKKLAKVPMHLKLMVVYWLLQVRWEIYNKNKSLFSGAGDGEGDWTECIMELAERNLFGNLQDTFQANFFLILKYLNKEKTKAKRAKKP